MPDRPRMLLGFLAGLRVYEDIIDPLAVFGRGGQLRTLVVAVYVYPLIPGPPQEIGVEVSNGNVVLVVYKDVPFAVLSSPATCSG